MYRSSTNTFNGFNQVQLFQVFENHHAAQAPGTKNPLMFPDGEHPVTGKLRKGQQVYMVHVPEECHIQVIRRIEKNGSSS